MTTQLFQDADTRVEEDAKRTSQDRADFLRRVVRWDAGLITIAALALILMSGPIATFMGVANPTVLLVAGFMGLLYDGGRILWLFQGDKLDRRLGQISLYANVAWVLASIPLLAFEWLTLSNGGWWVMAILADFAALFAVLQWYGLRGTK